MGEPSEKTCGAEMHGHDMKDMENMEPGSMMLMHPAHVPWVQSAVIILGTWLIASPLTLNHGSRALLVSDVVCGVVAVAVALLALKKRLARLSYANAAVGAWLMAAPLIFWTKSEAVYLQDTLIGALLIVFAVLVPMGMTMKGPAVPPGWTYNPSSWPQRAPIVLLALVGFFLARHMAAFQLGHTDWTWEPFFDDGTRRVLTSDVSRAWPISDAGLGAMTYLLEMLSTLMGDQRRWRTMPWMVALFGVIVVPLGVVSIVLIIMQPLMVGAWCTPCLVSAAAMLVMIPLALDEIVAMLQFMASEKRRGVGLWHSFWYGGTPEGAQDQEKPERRPSWRPRPMAWGVGVPWTLAASVAVGVWLMFAPAVLGSGGAFADSDHLVGALIIVVAVIAMGEVARPLRWLNAAFGAWLVLAPFVLEGGARGAGVSDILAGLVLIALSVRRGDIVEHYGSYDRALRRRRILRRHTVGAAPAAT